MSSTASTPTTKKVGEYVSAPFTPYRFEEELEEDIKLDDAAVLEKRYRERARSLSSVPSSSDAVKERKSVKSQTQWTRSLDAVQEHFSSHVTLDGISHKLPPIIYALKLTAKHNWILYKKRECERRKRIRRKIEREKANEKNGRPSNVLMAMVDICESCKRLFVTVNLFWGVTLCDSCYFSPYIIQDLMAARMEVAKRKIQITPDNIVQEVVRLRKSLENKSYFNIREPTPPPPPPPSSPSLNELGDMVSREEEEEEEDNSLSPVVVMTRSPSICKSPPPLSPGGSPGNALEKSEVAENIICRNDSPFDEENLLFEDDIELPPSPDSFDNATISSNPSNNTHKKKRVPFFMSGKVEEEEEGVLSSSPSSSSFFSSSSSSVKKRKIECISPTPSTPPVTPFTECELRDLDITPATPHTTYPYMVSFSQNSQLSQGWYSSNNTTEHSSQQSSFWGFDSTNSRAYKP